MVRCWSLEQTRAFVLAEYFGYLRRNPSDVGFDGQPDPNFDGYNFWLNKLKEFTATTSGPRW
jgi:hypothetical protein